MARYVTEVQTQRSGDEAFDLLADFTSVADWDPGVVAAQRLDAGDLGVGSRFRVVVGGPRPFTLEYEVTEFEAPHRLALEAQSATLRSLDTITVTPDPGGATVTYDARLSLRGPLAVLDLALRPLFRRIGDRAAAGLRDFLGSTATSRAAS